MNTHILTAIDITVVLYFFLLLFKFLYAKTPPVLNTFLMVLGVFSFFPFIFISSEFLRRLMGVTLLALLLDTYADKYIVTNPKAKDKIIDQMFTPNSIPIYSFK